MGYIIFTHEQITPEKLIRPRLEGGNTLVENPARAVFPDGSQVEYWPEGYNRFSADPSRRTVLLKSAQGTATGSEIFAAFPAIRDPKADEIRAEGARRLAILAAPYTPEERETWATQQREARAWLIDNTTPVPMITALATNRGITVDELVGKVMENVALFESASGAILGHQQRLLDNIYAATDYDAMKAINWGAL